jgi:hypothetical protein
MTPNMVFFFFFKKFFLKKKKKGQFWVYQAFFTQRLDIKLG